MNEQRNSPDVVIIGAGLAGLQCAYKLSLSGVSWQLLEASDSPGGRIRSTQKEGFILDEGFQVFLTAYKTASANLDLKALSLKSFLPGAVVAHSRQKYWVGDPLRVPSKLFNTLFSPLLSLKDKLLMLQLKQSLSAKSTEAIGSSPSMPTTEYLEKRGFSASAIAHFFRPFFSGIFLEPNLKTSSRLFEFVFKHFSLGYAALPEAGMQAIPKQLAARLSAESVCYNTVVTAINIANDPANFHTIVLENAEVLSSKQIILATDLRSANRLIPAVPVGKFNHVNTLYYSAHTSPLPEPVLLLVSPDGATGPINHLCVPSDIQPSYAPTGKSLISVSTFEDLNEETIFGVKKQLKELFGNVVDEWCLLETVSIPYALPEYKADKTFPEIKGLVLAGDYCESPSIEGAFISGNKAAEKVLAALQQTVQ